ncbi:unnamed protein product [Musa acuminata var. zebrina]
MRSRYHEPDVLLPVSKPDGHHGSGFGHRVDNVIGVEATTIVVPRNAYRAVAEIFVVGFAGQ